MQIRQLTAAQTYPLRNLVLRPGRPLSACVWPGDDAPEAIHLGVEVATQIVTIASVTSDGIPPQLDGVADPRCPYRLRGMATHPDHRGRGYGSALLAECIERVRRAGGDLLWCNARTPAVDFYRLSGFSAAGEEFETEVGPHFVMWLDLIPLGR